MAKKVTFEEKLKKLEENLKKLEDTEIGLDEAIKIYEENKELCKIIIERFENEYLITLKLFDKNLYKKCRDTKYIIDEELKIFDNLKLKMEYANE
mgnify:CR=1 FL=1